ncbi:MAG: hypothetical protein JST86_04180 [Bacteroidetes bacterium]|nr:hypothetical protein [Bacteroidota bacterium]
MEHYAQVYSKSIMIINPVAILSVKQIELATKGSFNDFNFNKRQLYDDCIPED